MPRPHDQSATSVFSFGCPIEQRETSALPHAPHRRSGNESQLLGLLEIVSDCRGAAGIRQPHAGLAALEFAAMPSPGAAKPKRTLDKWASCRVGDDRKPNTAAVDEFDRVLSDAADERPLQTFLAAHPSLLGPLTPPGGTFWCLDRPRLGSEWIPDFLLASVTSAGFRWVLIELESPNKAALTKGGLPAQKLAEAQRQVRDWRTWLTDNVAYAREERGLTDIEGTCRAYIVIGRRGGLDPRQAKTYRALSTDQTTVMSYDRLRDAMSGSEVPNG